MLPTIYSILLLIFSFVVLPRLYPKIMFYFRNHKDVPELLVLPFEGSWYTLNGGNVWSNHHIDLVAQQFAYDFIIVDKTKTSHQNNGQKNEDYYCFGKAILAPHEGTIVIAVDGIPDNRPGELNPQMIYGNTIMLQHPEGFVSVLAHLKQDSVCVGEGEKVAKGQQLADCGNSGNSTEPHLHFHVQTQVGFEIGVGLKPHFSNTNVDGDKVKLAYLRHGQTVMSESA